MVTKIPKVRVIPDTALEAHQASSAAAAVDRFANAAAITKQQPDGLAPRAPSVQSTTRNVVQAPQFTETITVTTAVDLGTVPIGAIVKVPLHLVDLNKYGPRQVYSMNTVDVVGSTIDQGQDDAAHGYIEEGRVKLIDGGTRFLAAQSKGVPTLDVKIEEAPANAIELFLRARDLNEKRSGTTPFDFAMVIKKLLDDGHVATQAEIAEKIPAPNSGGKMSPGTVSQYISIASMPTRVQQRMIDWPETSTMAALYAISQLFSDKEQANDEDQINLALDLCDEIKDRKLNKEQIAKLIQSRLTAPKQRDRSVVQPLEVFGLKANIKTFPKKGRLELSLSGLTPEQSIRVRDAVVNALKGMDT